MLAEQPFQARDDPRRDAVWMIVCRRHLDRGDHLARRRVDGDDVGERPADVDPDPEPCRGAQPSSSSTVNTTSGNAAKEIDSPRCASRYPAYRRSTASV